MTKLLLLLCCTYAFASHHSHVIPVENYETELQDLGQYVEEHETPVKVIKITKTIAVKIPVPYPVKVVKKVPYPVHVNKPYPVHVPHIVQIPHERKVQLKPKHESTGYNTIESPGDSYKVQESPSHESFSGTEHSYAPSNENVHSGELGGYNYGNNHNLGGHGNAFSQGAPANSYDAPIGGHYGYTGEDGNTYESKIHNAINSYL